MLLVAGNTMAQSIRERIPELAILKTLGFSDVAVLGMVLSESLLVVLIGGLIGVGLAAFFLQGMAAQFASILPGLVFTGKIFLQALIVMLLLGFFTGILPALQGMRLNIVTALRRR
jgi:putative ABC transport system permease protein